MSFTEAENACEQRLLSHGTLTGKVSPLFSGPKSYHQLRTISTGIGPKRDPKTGPSFSTFLNFFCFKISLFWTPHVISRKLDSNCTSASSRPLLAGIV